MYSQPFFYQRIQIPALLLCQCLSQIGLGIFRVIVQHFLKESVRLVPVTVFQGHIAPIQQGSDLTVPTSAYNDLFLDFGCWRVFRQNLLNPPQQILHSSHLAHVLGLKLGKLLGHIIGVDVLIAGDQVLRSILGHEH